ncbi:MAG: hypothetical protein IK115_03630 [Lachnospiraceae bacterium]|nr:hypothetical protein [Lachnospiraceae bacterium]
MGVNSFGSFFGDIEKAVIEIVDNRGTELKVNGPVGVNIAGQGGYGSFVSAPAVPGEAANGPASYLQAAGQKSLLNTLEGGVKRSASRKRYVVQFNPSSITLRGHGEGYVPTISYTKETTDPKPDKQSVRIFFSVRLVVDQVDNFDAFLEDKTNLSPTQLGQNILKQIPKFKKEPSVKDTVEGFIGALRCTDTRIVTFHWGQMNYSGVMNNVNAQYVMFNRKGQPVRAYINLSLQCTHDDPLPNSLGPWEAAYEKAFGVNGIANNRAVGAAQKYGSFINLG